MIGPHRRRVGCGESWSLSSLLVVLVILVTGGWQASAADNRHPMELVAVAGGELWIVEEDGGLLGFDPDTRRLRRLAVRSRAYQAHDITARGSGKDLRVFVLMSRLQVGAKSYHRIVAFDPSGRPVKEWKSFPHDVIGGMVADTEEPRLFLSDAIGRRLYSLDLRRDGAAPDGITSVFRATRLGAVAFDAEGDRLYLADPARSRVLVVPSDGGTASEFSDDLGMPAALAIDQPRNRLLVLDALNGQVWAVPLSEDRPPFLLADLPDWGDPLGLEVTAEGRIWVADRTLGTLTELMSNGDVAQVVDLNDLPVR